MQPVSSLPSLTAGTSHHSSYRQQTNSSLNSVHKTLQQDLKRQKIQSHCSLRSSTRLNRRIPMPIDTYGVNQMIKSDANVGYKVAQATAGEGVKKIYSNQLIKVQDYQNNQKRSIGLTEAQRKSVQSFFNTQIEQEKRRLIYQNKINPVLNRDDKSQPQPVKDYSYNDRKAVNNRNDLLSCQYQLSYEIDEASNTALPSVSVTCQEVELKPQQQIQSQQQLVNAQMISRSVSPIHQINNRLQCQSQPAAKECQNQTIVDESYMPQKKAIADTINVSTFDKNPIEQILKDNSMCINDVSMISRQNITDCHIQQQDDTNKTSALNKSLTAPQSNSAVSKSVNHGKVRVARAGSNLLSRGENQKQLFRKVVRRGQEQKMDQANRLIKATIPTNYKQQDGPVAETSEQGAKAKQDYFTNRKEAKEDKEASAKNSQSTFVIDFTQSRLSEGNNLKPSSFHIQKLKQRQDNSKLHAQQTSAVNQMNIAALNYDKNIYLRNSVNKKTNISGSSYQQLSGSNQSLNITNSSVTFINQSREQRSRQQQERMQCLTSSKSPLNKLNKSCNREDRMVVIGDAMADISFDYKSLHEHHSLHSRHSDSSQESVSQFQTMIKRAQGAQKSGERILNNETKIQSRQHQAQTQNKKGLEYKKKWKNCGSQELYPKLAVTGSNIALRHMGMVVPPISAEKCILRSNNLGCGSRDPSKNRSENSRSCKTDYEVKVINNQGTPLASKKPLAAFQQLKPSQLTKSRVKLKQAQKANLMRSSDSNTKLKTINAEHAGASSCSLLPQKRSSLVCQEEPNQQSQTITDTNHQLSEERPRPQRPAFLNDIQKKKPTLDQSNSSLADVASQQNHLQDNQNRSFATSQTQGPQTLADNLSAKTSGIYALPNYEDLRKRFNIDINKQQPHRVNNTVVPQIQNQDISLEEQLQQSSIMAMQLDGPSVTGPLYQSFFGRSDIARGNTYKGGSN